MLRFTDNLIMQLTRDCNLNCTYCFQGQKTEWKNKKVDLNTFKSLVDYVIYHRCILGNIENSIDLHFHGGEITLIDWETLTSMIEYVEKRRQFFTGITICTQTNGVNLTEEMCRYFKEHNITVGVSIDGFHSNDRYSAEYSKELVEKLRDLSCKTGCQFSILSVLTKNNIYTWYEDMKSVSDFIKSVGVNIMIATPERDYLVPTEEEQWEYWIKPVLDSYLTDTPIQERNVDIAISKALQDIIFSCDKTSFYSNKTGCFDRICGHGSNMISIDPDLTLSSCDKYLEEGDYIDKRHSKSLFDRDFLGLQQINNCLKHYKAIIDLEKQYGCDNCKANWICNGECQSYMISKYGECRFNEKMCDIFIRAFEFIENNWIELITKNRFRVVGKVNEIRPTILDALKKANIDLQYDIHTNTYTGVRRS